MKRIGGLYGRIYTMDNLVLAEQKARKGKSQQYGVKAFDADKENKLIELQDILKNDTFKTSDYIVFTIQDPKEREIYKLPYYPDRIVQHAIVNILDPIFIGVFTTDSYSSIKGCLLYTSPSPRDLSTSRMPSSA